MLTVRSTINIASQTVPPIIPVVQGDTGRAILFTLADFTIPAGATATYYVQKPSGEAVYNNATIDGNNVLVELTAQSIIEKGDNYGQVRITVGEEVVTSFDFILLVKEFRGIDAVQSLTEMNIFDKAVEQASEAIDEVKTDALEAIDDAKDEAIEEVTSNFDLKLDASSTKGVQNQVITQAINTVNNAIGDLSGETVTPTATNNYGVGGNVGQVIETWATTEYWHGIYTVSAGNTYGITTVSDFPQQIVVWFTNSSNVILEIHKAFATDHVEMVCTAPTGATKLFVMSYGYDAYHGTVQKVEPLSETVSNLKDDLTAAQVELAKKANTDGYYEEMTVGNAEQLVSTVTNADDTPYNFRTTAGSADVGDRAYVDAIVGGSLVVNQYFTFTEATATKNGITFVRKADSTITVSGTATANSAYEIITIPLIGGHTYLLTGCPQGGGANKYALYANDTNPQLFDAGVGSIRKQFADTNGRFYIIVYSGQTVDLTFVPQLSDITQIFGTTIADYVYGLETATTGAGVAWLKANAPKIFDGGYIPFNAGTLQSVVGLSEKRNTGLNQWDEETELGAINHTTGEDTASTTALRSKNYTDIVGGSVYCFRQGANSIDFHVHWYDANKNFISYEEVYTGANINYKTVTAPSTARYMRFNLPNGYGTTYKHDICVNLHWDGEKDGIYEPYTVHTYAFDPTVELRGVPKLKDGKMYYDGDRYLPDGTVQRRYGVVDLGTLKWITGADKFYTDTNVSPAYKNPVSTSIADRNIGCSKYAYAGGAGTGTANLKDKSLYYDWNNIGRFIIRDDSYTDSASFKAAMSGVMLVYELATSTTETAEPYNPVEIVDDFGTEEFITTSLVPVGHETRYAPNLRAKLEMSPDSPDGDGLYIVQQSGGENTYIPLASSATIQNILERLTALEGNTNEG